MVPPNLVRTFMENSILESAADEHRECKYKGEWRHDLELTLLAASPGRTEAAWEG
jgi:hypothetical protein